MVNDCLLVVKTFLKQGACSYQHTTYVTAFV